MKQMTSLLGLGLLGIVSVTGCSNAISQADVSEQAMHMEVIDEKSSLDISQKPEIIELTISAAASLKEAMTQIESMYEAANPHIDLLFTFGGSGALMQQIEQGAPSDIFISAAQKQMTMLEDKGYILESSKKDLLENKVVLIVPVDQGLELTSFEDVVGEKVTSLGLGEPGSVPVGQYAEEIFTTLGILETIKNEEKIVYAKDVKEVLSWVATGNVDAGVVYATDAKTTDDVNVICEAPIGSYSPAIYPVGVIKESKHVDVAEDFVAYLSSEDVKSVFEGLGFTVK